MPFEISLAGEKFRTDELTVEEFMTIERDTGRTWWELNPVRSAPEFRAVAVAFLSRTRSKEDALKIVSALTINDVVAATKLVRDDLPDVYEDGIPKAEGGPLTPSSSNTQGLPGAGPHQ